MSLNLDLIADECLEGIKNTLLGNLIGFGMNRKVYECKVNPNYVIKLEQFNNTAYTQNAMEYNIWQEVYGTPHEKWFAPVVSLSHNTTCLIMRKTQPIVSKSNLPKRIPKYLTDLKPENYGWYNGHFVCHDYGLTNILRTGLTKATKPLKWNL